MTLRIAPFGLTLAAATVALVTGMDSAGAATKLTVYTALENEQLAPYKKSFEADNPGVEIEWVRDSTGVITAKLLAEKDNPRADVVWGVAASSLMILDKQGMLQPYAPKGVEALKPAFRDAKAPPAWVGMDAWMAAICFNTVEAEKKKLPKPTSWADLLKPEYKGQVVMPNPASSGTGFLAVSGWLQTMGQDKGWAYMDKLNDNVAVYTHSGSKPCKMAAAGEYAIGISIEYTGAQQKTKGAPIDVILASEGAGWEMEATAIVKGTKNLGAAQKLADWAASKKASELYVTFYQVTAHPGVTKDTPNYPKDAEASMIKNNDFAWAAANRDAILAEWAKRYNAKSEPKS
ncbi:putative 2-aminoethylphosphonate ABC transporter substrate-binding protein [Azospirillum thermophilum]|uniref:Putative 2-aminoethylphosphonate ABC transporter substrate-binding protein n=1 Tax=Azospirillum thermophilum TaxID=2202148 RepID=A0A2S2CKG4_9PROT|nr:putative 2-aminoethylphosphonate ABC transporter substrate-binding protein [Azospirillum thermophilum]AWK84984.1 putative 2-aminoethylphosphonate ABC transporter substrate-binding protein [Azospirillum thermophilum]